MASWSDQPQPQAQGQPGFAGGGKATHNPLGGSLTSENIQIESTAPRSIDAIEIIKEVVEIMKQKPAETFAFPLVGFFVLFVIQMIINFGIGLVVGIVQAVAVKAVGGDAGQIVAVVMQFGTSLVTGIFSTVIQSALMGAVYIMWLRILRGQNFTFENLAEVKPFIIPLILTNILMQIGIVVGFIFLIVPGILLALGLGMAPYLVIDKNIKYIDALKASWSLMDGRKMEWFIFSLILFAMNLVGLLACGMGLIVTMPISLGAMVYYYNAIAEPGNAYAKDLGNATNVFR